MFWVLKDNVFANLRSQYQWLPSVMREQKNEWCLKFEYVNGGLKMKRIFQTIIANIWYDEMLFYEWELSLWRIHFPRKTILNNIMKMPPPGPCAKK